MHTNVNKCTQEQSNQIKSKRCGYGVQIKLTAIGPSSLQMYHFSLSYALYIGIMGYFSDLDYLQKKNGLLMFNAIVTHISIPFDVNIRRLILVNCVYFMIPKYRTHVSTFNQISQMAMDDGGMHLTKWLMRNYIYRFKYKISSFCASAFK